MRTFPIILAILISGAVLVPVSFLLGAHFGGNNADDELIPNGDLTIEDNVTDVGDDSDKLAQNEGGGAVSINFGDQAMVFLSEGTVTLDYENPSSSNQSMVVELVVQNTVLAQSGYLDPGNRLDTIPLEDGISAPEGDYQGDLMVYFYDQETRELANAQVAIPVTVHVAM
jgi:hypothetical protein